MGFLFSCRSVTMILPATIIGVVVVAILSAARCSAFVSHPGRVAVSANWRRPERSYNTPSKSMTTATSLFFHNSTRSEYEYEQLDGDTAVLTVPKPMCDPKEDIAAETKESSSSSITIGRDDYKVSEEITITQEDEETATEEDNNKEFDFAPFDGNNCFPGRDENPDYRCHPSVAIWRDFKSDDAQRNLREMAKIVQRFSRSGPRAGAYFMKHLGRTAYFAVTGLLGNAAFDIVSAASNKDGDVPDFRDADNGSLSMKIGPKMATGWVLEAMLCYEEDWFGNIAKGLYREPWDMTTSNHRQSNPLFALRQTSRFVREAAGIMGRRSRGTQQDKEVSFFRDNPNRSKRSRNRVAAVVHTKKDFSYPEYFQTAFHYQGDGWMSEDSANVYETSTETIFVGRQDAMQRATLPPLLEFSRRHFGAANSRKKGRPMRVLEIACGTGRFLTFIRDNLPLDAECTAVDLSPFYLEKVAENDDYWRKTRQEAERRRGNSRQSISPATLVQAKAEELPFEDGQFDAVVCTYLFHELPRNVRAKAVAEFARVVAPGGVVVLTDSLQKGDRPALDKDLHSFGDMNEPFYVDYANDNLGAHFEREGLVPRTKIQRSNTKSLSFSKPGDLPQ